MFSNYPLKAIEELATKFEQRIYKAGEVVAKNTQQLSEILIIYHGQASLFRENNPDPFSCNYQSLLSENQVLCENDYMIGTILAHSEKLKVLVLHKMFLKDTLRVRNKS